MNPAGHLALRKHESTFLGMSDAALGLARNCKPFIDGSTRRHFLPSKVKAVSDTLVLRPITLVSTLVLRDVLLNISLQIFQPNLALGTYSTQSQHDAYHLKVLIDGKCTEPLRALPVHREAQPCLQPPQWAKYIQCTLIFPLMGIP